MMRERGNCKTLFLNKSTHSMYGDDCDAAIAKVAAAVTRVQSQSQEVSSGDGRAGLVVF